MNQSNLKIMVRGAYDIQKMRIQMGNRIVANFKAKLGQKPGTSEDELDEKAKGILAEIRLCYLKITDGVKVFPQKKSFKGDAIISDYTEFCLFAQYHELEGQEKKHFSRMKGILADYPIYTKFLEQVKGVGPAMAGVIISEIDIHKAKHPSSLWAYAGLDTAVWFDRKLCLRDDAPARLYKRHPEGYTTTGPDRIGAENNHFLLYAPDGAAIGTYGLPVDETKGLWQGRSRKAEHLVQKKYTTRNGEEAERNSITFNPFLKTKLVGVLGPSFLRAGGKVGSDGLYYKIYQAYKARLETSPAHMEKTKLHRDNMAIRYMLKRFLADLYREWRTLEGLPISQEYHLMNEMIQEGVI